MKNKTSIVFSGDVGFDRYMDRKWEDNELLSKAEKVQTDSKSVW